MAITAVIETKAGILQAINLFGNEEEAVRFGRDQWLAEGRDDSLMMDNPDYDKTWGGVRRGYAMHWFTDHSDVWVVTPGPDDMGKWMLLSPEMQDAIGRHTIEAAAEEVVNA